MILLGDHLPGHLPVGSGSFKSYLLSKKIWTIGQVFLRALQFVLGVGVGVYFGFYISFNQ